MRPQTKRAWSDVAHMSRKSLIRRNQSRSDLSPLRPKKRGESLFAVPPETVRGRPKVTYRVFLLLLVTVAALCLFSVHAAVLVHDNGAQDSSRDGHQRQIASKDSGTSINSSLVTADNGSSARTGLRNYRKIPEGFDMILERSTQHADKCKSLEDDFRGFDVRSVLPFHNDTVVSLPAFGITRALQNYFSGSQQDDMDWPVCQMPPDNECDETQLTVVFMAYNPDRLGITMKQIRSLLDPKQFHGLVHEIVMVWNGDRYIDESNEGKTLLEFTKDNPVRIVYPLKMGFPNDLMNRYHPNVVKPTTKALLYYDDDGPFYSYAAIQGGFELWKRHSSAQIGAMARQISYSERQRVEQVELLGVETNNAKKAKARDDEFVSHCTNTNDKVDYNFRFFANYDANMVLPSGSMLHSNYLCYLWHPALAEIRQFVLDHPVHPDDMTVSMIVSQLSGVAPRVYSRRLNPQEKKDTKVTAQRRQLSQKVLDESDYEEDYYEEEEPSDLGIVPQSEQQRHRSLLFSICWDCGSQMTDMKQMWAELRTEAVNSLVRYFGSINSGSIGWCEPDSEHYNSKKDGRCEPIMARQGWLPWMNPDGTPSDTCP